MDKQQLALLLQQALSIINNSMPTPVATPARMKREKLSARLTNNLLLLSSIWAGLTIALLSLLDATISSSDLERPVGNPGFVAGAVIIIILQFTQIILIVMTSVKLTKQMLHHTATSNFLFQSYMSTILLFAAVYTLLYRLDISGWDEVYSGAPKNSDYVSKVFVRFLYFSISTMTSTGFGDIHPFRWYTYLIVSVEMLLGVLYSTVILARGMDLLARPMANALARASVLPYQVQSTGMEPMASASSETSA